MTREEAIRVLEDNRPSVIFEDEDAQKRMAELCQAIDMAIDALSANEGLFCALADRKCFAQGYEFAWCITCPHISEEDRQLVNHAVMPIPPEDKYADGERREP